MRKVSTLGIDLAKNIFQLHGTDVNIFGAGDVSGTKAVACRALVRSEVLLTTDQKIVSGVERQTDNICAERLHAREVRRDLSETVVGHTMPLKVEFLQPKGIGGVDAPKSDLPSFSIDDAVAGDAELRECCPNTRGRC